MASLWRRFAYQSQELHVDGVGVFLFWTPFFRGQIITEYQPPQARMLEDSWESYLNVPWLEIPAGARTSEGELVVTAMIRAVDYREALAIYRQSVGVNHGR